LRVPPRPAGETFDEIAHAFDATRSRPWPFVEDWLGTERDRRAPGPVLDVGCGNGRHLQVAASMGLPCLGVDASPALVSIARTRLPADAGLLVGDARALPLRRGAAGSVMAVALLHHVRGEAGRRVAAEELHRVAAPGARGLVSVWALDDPAVANRARARPVPGGAEGDLLVPWRAPGGPALDRYYRAIGLEELVGLLGGAGLSVERTFREGANHVVLFLRRG
jgi:SAM-dependent methyltransferase